MSPGETVSVGGHRLQLTNLDKVLYPRTGTTKAEVLAYYTSVADALIPHAMDRPATRKRWPNGTGHPAFFHKNLDTGTPSWVRRRQLQHSGHATTYPLVNDLATLTWFGQIAALEIHVPQWRFGRTGIELPPDRLVLDLDPGPGVGLAACAEVARVARSLLTGMGLNPLPVTSGSKGLHLYAALDGAQDSAAVTAVAKELARYLADAHPDLVVAEMAKSLRTGKVFIDWSQNNGHKTTVVPYSLRGREHPWVAAPRAWEELDDPDLRQLDLTEVAERVRADGDLLAALTAGHLAALEPTPARMATFTGTDRLTPYRAKRDARRTPEPVPPAVADRAPGNTFVIQEHHARRLHWDFRLERDGVLVSWALPKGEPTDPGHNHLAVQTEDHPLAYGTFEGSIPRGEYGAGEVTIWDAGTYDLEKWRDDEEVIVTLHGERQGTRRLALIHTGGRGPAEAQHWLIHRMKLPAPEPTTASPTTPDDTAPAPVDAVARADAADAAARAERAATSTGSRAVGPMRPMLATPATALTRRDVVAQGTDWAIEMKWDGFRALIDVDDGVRLTSRNGQDMTPTFPELQALAAHLPPGSTPATFDGEIVALDGRGRPSFRRLQQRANLLGAADVAVAKSHVGVDLMLFDLLSVAGRSWVAETYDNRRAELHRLLSDPPAPVHIPPAFLGDLDSAVTTSIELGLEGVVAKRRDSPYAAGRRSSRWVKIKHTRTQEAVVIGWRPGHGQRVHLVGSLLLAVPDETGLRYVGRVGSGLTDADRRGLSAELARIGRSAPTATGVPPADARDAHWVEPVRVAEVRFTDWTGEGADARLRHPVWRGWRPDKDPGEVAVEAGG